MSGEYRTKKISRCLSLERIAFLMLLVLVAVFFWLPAYLPMIDVLQHAGQAGALKLFLQGEEHWRNQVTLNHLGPYWIGYGSWLLGSLFPRLHRLQGSIDAVFLVLRGCLHTDAP